MDFYRIELQEGDEHHLHGIYQCFDNEGRFITHVSVSSETGKVNFVTHDGGYWGDAYEPVLAKGVRLGQLGYDYSDTLYEDINDAINIERLDLYREAGETENIKHILPKLTSDEAAFALYNFAKDSDREMVNHLLPYANAGDFEKSRTKVEMDAIPIDMKTHIDSYYQKEAFLQSMPPAQIPSQGLGVSQTRGTRRL